VVPHYLDHRTVKHQRQPLSQQEITKRDFSYMPARRVKMLHYFGFLAYAYRKRRKRALKVYNAPEMTMRKNRMNWDTLR